VLAILSPGGASSGRVDAITGEPWFPHPARSAAAEALSLAVIDTGWAALRRKSIAAAFYGQ